MWFRKFGIDPFEIPDNWLTSTGADKFSPNLFAYRSSHDPNWPTIVVPVQSVIPPKRNTGIPNFDKTRMISLLDAIVRQTEVPPLEVCERDAGLKAPLILLNGYHRFFASVALGFSMLPVSVRKKFEFETE